MTTTTKAQRPTPSPETVKTGDQVRIRGDRDWFPVLSVHDQGVEIMDKASHHWFRWNRITKHKGQK